MRSAFSVAEVVGSKDGVVENLVREIGAQCGEVSRFEGLGDDAWKQALSDGKKVVVMVEFEDLPSAEDERRGLLADNGTSQLPFQT